jgi:hypothetical protein
LGPRVDHLPAKFQGIREKMNMTLPFPLARVEKHIVKDPSIQIEIEVAMTSSSG